MPPSNRSDLVRQLDSIFDADSVAVIGASSVPGKWGFTVFSRLILSHAERKLYPVNRQADEVLGIKAYPNVDSIPGAVELILAHSPAGDRAPALRKLRENNVFVYPSPERAARVLIRLVQYGEYLAEN